MEIKFFYTFRSFRVTFSITKDKMKNSNSLCWTHVFRELISNAWVLSYLVKEPLKRVERNFFTNQSCVPQRQEQRAKFVTILKATALDEIALKTIP